MPRTFDYFLTSRGVLLIFRRALPVSYCWAMILGSRATDTKFAADGTVLEQRTPGDDLRTGDLLDDRFEILSEMCKGGMATIFKARDRRDHDEPVVLKVPHKSVEMDQNLFSRFEREEQIGLR